MKKTTETLPVYTPEPMTTTANPADFGHVEPRSRRSRQVRPSSSSPSSSSSSRGTRWRSCAALLARTSTWVSRRRYELAPAGITSTLTILGIAQQGALMAGGADLTPFTYGLLTIGAGAATFLGLKHKNEVVTHVGGGGTLALADLTTASAAGLSWPTATAWFLSTGAAYGVYAPWLIDKRHARMKLNVDTVKARSALPSAMGLDAADPGLIGSTAQETALRRALHALVGATPRDIPAFHVTPDGGFTALIIMPAGRNTSPDAIIKKRVQLAANLGLTGTLQLTRGDDDNQLVARLIATDALAGTIPYSDDGGTSLADPVRLGLDEHGEAVEIQILYRHTLIAGASDWGKSGLLNLIIKRLVRRGDVDLYGIDMKPGSVELGPWAPLMKKVATGIEEAHALLDAIRAECVRRGDYLAELSRQALAEGREPIRKWIPGVHGNGIVVFTDELAELIRQDEELRKREAEDLKRMSAEEREDAPPARMPAPKKYESLLAIARSNAIQFVAATQQPSRRVFGGNTDARGNYANRLSTRTGEAGHGPLIFGQGSQTRGWRPELLDLPGKFLISTAEAGNEEPRECRAEYVTDQDIADDVGHLHARLVRSATAAAPPTRIVPQPPALLYPDGTPVGRDEWPDLYREFQALGDATKEQLTEVGPFASRDTVRRALDAWTQHGVQSRKDGRSTRYYLPTE